MAHIVHLCLQVLFQCAIHSSSVQSLYREHGCIDILSCFLPDIEVRVLTRAFLLCLLPEFEPNHSLQVLKEDEIAVLREMLGVSDYSVPMSYHTLSYTTLFEIVKLLLKVAGNSLLFIQWDIPDLLAQLSEKLPENLVEEQEQLAEIIWKLMEFQSEGDTNATGNLEPVSNQLEYSGM